LIRGKVIGRGPGCCLCLGRLFLQFLGYFAHETSRR
jgi:hypothetical protein